MCNTFVSLTYQNNKNYWGVITVTVSGCLFYLMYRCTHNPPVYLVLAATPACGEAYVELPGYMGMLHWWVPNNSKTVVYSSHSLGFIYRLSTTVALIKRGLWSTSHLDTLRALRLVAIAHSIGCQQTYTTQITTAGCASWWNCYMNLCIISMK